LDALVHALLREHFGAENAPRQGHR
jgi:hypothetical protein